MKNKLLFVFLLLFTFIGRVYATDYSSPTVVFNNPTQIKYLTDEDKTQFVNKFALNEYDGAVVVTNNPTISFVLDFDNFSNANDYDLGIPAEYILSSEEKITSYPGYTCLSVGSGYNDFEVADIRRNGNNLSLGLMYGYAGEYGACVKTSNSSTHSLLVNYTFSEEGMIATPLIVNEEGVIFRIFIYYISNINESVLNFKSSGTTVSTTLPAITDTQLEPFTSKMFDLKTEEGVFKPTYYGILHDNDSSTIYDTTSEPIENNVTILTPENGFDFILDFDNSTIKQDEIRNISVYYYGYTRNGEELSKENEYSESFIFAHGYLMEEDQNHNYNLTNKSIEEGIKIKGMNELGFTPSIALVLVDSVDIFGPRSIIFAYDTPENRTLLNFSDLEEIEYDDYIPGDLNKDGEVNLPDVIKVLRIYLGIDTASSEDITIGDMNDDDEIGLQDVIAILRIYLGIN